jgi:hypothetical protein
MHPKFGIRTSSRIVILTPSRVYKIPVNLRGWLQGINEQIVWNNFKGTKRLAPLLWSVGGFVCMRRVKTVTYVPPYIVKEVKQEIPIFAFENCDLWNVENWGTFGHEFVLLDYGINRRVAAMY